jgi:penicillin-binding protein 2
VTEGRTGLRLKVLAALILAMFAALTTRLWFLQVLAVEQYRNAAADNSVRLIETPAKRGRILDATNEVLVDSRISRVLTINREELGDDVEDVLFRLSQVMEAAGVRVSATELGDRMDTTEYYVFTPVPVAVDVPLKVELYLKEHTDDFPGVDVVETPVRTYPLGTGAAHVLGYLGQIDEDELALPSFADYQGGDIIGQTGVEAVYEHDLVGTPGIIKYLVNSQGETIRSLGRQPSESGNDVVLTLDAGIQRIAEESLRLGMITARGIFDESSGRNLTADAGAVIVMDPDTGGIEAMASLPNFNPALFTRSMSQYEIDRRFLDPQQGSPLLNRAIAGEYPPGSTYKPWIALSALQRERLTGITTQRYYPCPGTWITPFDEDDPDAQLFPFDNWTSANLGSMTLATALARSCDTVFYPIGYSYWRDYYNFDGETVQTDLDKLGFGQLTHVDLPFEADGRVPTAAWKAAIHEDNPNAFPEGDWFPADYILMSIGQGDSLVTPLQLATAFAGLQNENHEVCTPHVLDRVVDPETNQVIRREEPNCRRLRFDPANLDYVREALTGTVRGSGTAAGSFSGFPFEQVWVAGKTGTAEVPPKQDLSWFAAMTESAGERHVVVVVVEQGGHGSTTAAPIARRIIEGMYGLEYTQFTELDLDGTDF